MEGKKEGLYRPPPAPFHIPEPTPRISSARLTYGHSLDGGGRPGVGITWESGRRGSEANAGKGGRRRGAAGGNGGREGRGRG